MSKKIHCVECNLFLGDIRDASLRRNIVHLCTDCNNNRIAEKMLAKTRSKDWKDDLADYSEIFGDIFGKKR